MAQGADWYLAQKYLGCREWNVPLLLVRLGSPTDDHYESTREPLDNGTEYDSDRTELRSLKWTDCNFVKGVILKMHPYKPWIPV